MLQESMSESSSTPSWIPFLHVMPLQTPHAEMQLTHSSCSCIAGCCNLHYNCSLWTGVAPQEPWGLLLELANNHGHLMSIPSHWGPETCFVEGSSPGSVGRHGECCAAAASVGGRGPYSPLCLPLPLALPSIHEMRPRKLALSLNGISGVLYSLYVMPTALFAHGGVCVCVRERTLLDIWHVRSKWTVGYNTFFCGMSTYT